MRGEREKRERGERGRERGGESGVCAAGKRDLALGRQSASDASYFHLLQAGYTRTRSTRTHRRLLSVHNAHLLFEKHFKGRLAFGGPRQSPTFA